MFKLELLQIPLLVIRRYSSCNLRCSITGFAQIFLAYSAVYLHIGLSLWKYDFCTGFIGSDGIRFNWWLLLMLKCHHFEFLWVVLVCNLDLACFTGWVWVWLSLVLLASSRNNIFVHQILSHVISLSHDRCFRIGSSLICNGCFVGYQSFSIVGIGSFPRFDGAFNSCFVFLASIELHSLGWNGTCSLVIAVIFE